MLPWGLPGCQDSALTIHTRDSASPVSRSPTDFHTGTSKKYYPTTTVHQQEPARPFPHFRLVTSTRQIHSTCFSPESPIFFSRHTSIQPVKWLQKLINSSSSHCHFCDQFVVLSQPT